MTRYSSSTSRPLIWEDEAPAESRLRAMQQGVPKQAAPKAGPAAGSAQRSAQRPVRPSAGAAGVADDIDEEGFPRLTRQRYDDAPPRPWWRPASTVGRVFLGLAALAVLGGVITGILLVRHLIEHDSRFRIEGSANIQAAGLTEVSRAEMLPIFGEDIGRNIFFVPLAERRKQLEQIPWVEHAIVMRILPDQIRVSIVERQPVAFARQGEQVGLVDANGVLLSMPAAVQAQRHYSFPVLTGIDARDSLAGRRARVAVYRRMMADLDSSGEHISQQISEIDLTNPEDARVLMSEPGADIVAHFGDDHFLERYKRYKSNIAEWRQQHPNLAAVDLRYDNQVVLKMSGGATQTAAQAIDGAVTRPTDVQTAAAAANTGAALKPSPGNAAVNSAPASPTKKKNAATKVKKKHPQPKRAGAAKPRPHPAASAGQ